MAGDDTGDNAGDGADDDGWPRRKQLDGRDGAGDDASDVAGDNADNDARGDNAVDDGW